MPVEMYENLIGELKALGTKFINLGGIGEPILYKDIDQILKIAKKENIATTITTNMTVANKENLLAILENGVKSVTISMHAGSPEIYSTFTGLQPEDFEKVKENLKLLFSLSKEKNIPMPRIAINFVVVSANYKDIENACRFADELKANAINFIQPSLTKSTFHLHLTSEQHGKVYALTENLKKELNVTINNHHFKTYRPDDSSANERTRFIAENYPCVVPWQFSQILANGDIVGCCAGYRVLGNLYDSNFSQIWTGNEYKEFRSECLSLPERKTPVKKCHCFSCGHARGIAAFCAKHLSYPPLKEEEKELLDFE
jgi:MoaA/NifB/PqqE/SkfB family radical SAM enzyme